VTRRILITCSRSWKDWELGRRVLARMYELAPDAILVSGHNPRGDQDLERIWKSLGGQVETYPTRWRSGPGAPLNKVAGFERNERMARLPGVIACVAFIGPCDKEGCSLRGRHGSHGATHCADYAESVRGIRTRRFAAG
jgi:hypothetical protein